MIDVILTILLSVFMLCLCGVLVACMVLLFILIRRLWKLEKSLDD